MAITKTLSLLLAAGVAVSAVGLAGCGGTTTTRTSANEVKDLSGKWNDIDAQQVAKALIDSSLSNPWADKYLAKNNRNAKVKLGNVVVRANEEVNTAIFLKSIRKEFVNSGKVDVIDEDATQTRAEIADQANFAEKGKEAGKEEAADFLLKGTLNVQNDREGNQAVKFYQVDLELTDIQTKRIVWTDGKQIKKLVEGAGAKF